MKLIVAGTMKQYYNYIREYKLTPREAVYCCTKERLQGVDLLVDEIIFTGQGWLNPAYEDALILQDMYNRRRNKQKENRDE